MKVAVTSRLDKLSLGILRDLLSKCIIQTFDSVYVEPNVAAKLGLNLDVFLPWVTRVDALIAVGGDGTILRSLITIDYDVLVIGVGTGRVSKLAPLDASEACNVISKLAEGALPDKFFTSVRRLRLCTDEGFCTPPALNEVVIRASGGKIMDLEVRVECGTQDYTLRFRGDGLILSTSIGSTAYSSSAGGPLLACDCIALTPLNPMYVTPAKPLVIDHSCIVRIKARSIHRNPMLIVDGQWSTTLRGECCLVLKDAPRARILLKSNNG